MHPDQTQANDEPILGWLAIAAHLRVEKTTAQRWERQNGLPVHRLPGKRGGVYARAVELDGWRLTNEQEHAAGAAAADAAGAAGAAAADAAAWPDEAPAPAPRLEISGGEFAVRLPLRWMGWAAGVALAAALGWAAFAWFRPVLPAAFRLEGTTLVVTNAAGRPVWRHSFPVALRPEDPPLGRAAWIGELAYGEPFRVLFPLPPVPGRAGATLTCFDPRGRAEWEFVPPAGLEIEAFHAFPAHGRAQSRIVVSSADPWQAPNQVAILDGSGRLTGQYWHAGHLEHLAGARPDRDDPADVLLSGVDEARQQATVVGLGPNADSKLVILFPRSCVAEALGPGNQAGAMAWRAGVLRVTVRESAVLPPPLLIYEFDRSLKPVRVMLSAEYEARHRQLALAGRLNHSCEREAERLLDGVRVAWAARPGS